MSRSIAYFAVKTAPLAALALLVSAVVNVQAAVVKVEAESGTLGSSLVTASSSGVTYISNTNNNTGNTPGTPERVASYIVILPEAGTYDLYARVRVGSGGANDDSFLYGNGFGTKSPTTSSGWVVCNNLWNVGFTNASDVVTGGGSAQTGVWKWINLSQFTGVGSFTVNAGNLTQTFQIGGREDGLDIDAFSFGLSTLIFTVANLDAGTGGTVPPGATGACTVQWNDVRQVIDGFGASSAWRNSWSSALANMLFSTNSGTGFSRTGTQYTYTGIGLSLLRTRIAPGGTTVEFSIMQMAQARGARVWSAPWSPAPAAQFKSNGNVNGGSFIGNTNNYAAYASQMAAYVVNMKNQYGVDLYAISIQNEPDANVTTYESCNWTAQQIHDFVPYLRNALNANNVASTKIMLPESQNWTDPQGLRLTTLNDPVTAAMVDIVANHNYVANNAAGDQNTPAAINSFGKALWQTEVAKLSGDDSSIEDGLYWARRIHLFLTSAQANAWHYWWLCAYGTSNEGLCDTNDVPAKRMYTLGNFSRFVRPGYRRLGTTSSTGPLLVSAYNNLTNGNFAIVAINQSSSNVNQTINLSDFPSVNTVTPWITSAGLSLSTQSSVTVSNTSFAYQVPAKSVITFVGQAVAAPSNTPPTFLPVANRTVNAGVTLVLTNTATDPDSPVQQLTYNLLSVHPTNATLNSNNGVFTWRPLVSQADSTNVIIVKVTDNGTPNLSATNSFAVMVNPLAQPGFSSISSGDGFGFMVTGDAGPDYTLLTSTNMLDWEVLFTTNPPALPFSVVETNRGDAHRFYRLQLGP